MPIFSLEPLLLPVLQHPKNKKTAHESIDPKADFYFLFYLLKVRLS